MRRFGSVVRDSSSSSAALAWRYGRGYRWYGKIFTAADAAAADVVEAGAEDGLLLADGRESVDSAEVDAPFIAYSILRIFLFTGV